MKESITLRDLTVPTADTSTLRAVINGYLRESVRTFLALRRLPFSPPAERLFARTIAIVERELAADPRTIVSIFRRPTHAALLWSIVSRMGSDRNEPWMVELCLLIHLELALRGSSLPADRIERVGKGWPALRSIDGGFVLQIDPSVEEIKFSPHALLLHHGSESWEMELHGVNTPSGFPGRVESPYHRIVDGISLALTDNNPLSMEEAHPDKFGNAVDLGGHSFAEWADTLRAAFKLVDDHLPRIGEELRLLIRQIVPVGYHDQKHLSASYQEAVGTIYMTLHPNLMTMTEALIHEFQHNKLNAAFHLDPMLENAFSPLYASPVRPDPRPLHGVILAVHAFQPVAALYERMTEAGHPMSFTPDFQKRFRDIIRMNRAGSQTVLQNAKPTPTGAGLFDEMRALERHQMVYEETRWPAPATEPAQALPE